MRRQAAIEADYVGVDCPDHFVVGYGMDVAHAFRELPFVGVVTGDA
jgi:hypoxanthine phosphoribosyltransferase